MTHQTETDEEDRHKDRAVFQMGRQRTVLCMHGELRSGVAPGRHA